MFHFRAGRAIIRGRPIETEGRREAVAHFSQEDAAPHGGPQGARGPGSPGAAGRGPVPAFSLGPRQGGGLARDVAGPRRGPGANANGSGVAMAVLRRLGAGWLAISGRFGEAQTLVILGLLYALVFGPTGLAVAASRRDYLGRKDLGRPGSAWLEADSAKPDLERAKLLS